MMEQSPDRVLEHLVQIEQVAEEILSDKHQLIDLDRRRHQTREALRALYKQKDDQKQWVCFGNQLIKLPKTTTKKFLDKDFDELEDEINKVRKGLKPKLSKLRDVEHKEDLKGFNLTPLSRDEFKAIDGLL